MQFPYALKALPDVLVSKWEDDEFKLYRDAFPEDAQSSPEALQAHVEDLTKRDVKVAYHKNLQGYLWENGYKSGAYSTPLFSDVAPHLKHWKNVGYDLAIYSSGSVFAQKLLFGHVKSQQSVTGQKRGRSAENDDGEDGTIEPPLKKRAAVAESEDDGEPITETTGEVRSSTAERKDDSVDVTIVNGAEATVFATEDLQWLISDWFDTTNAGPKTEASSYEKIADVLKVRRLVPLAHPSRHSRPALLGFRALHMATDFAKAPPSNVLFLSDNVKEVDAARQAGMQTFMVDRPGNAPLPEEDKSRLSVVNSLDEIKLAGGTTDGVGTRSSPEQNPESSPNGALVASEAK